MDFTVYVLGDVSTFYATLNSVAMIFNATGFMKGVYLVGGFVALISGIMFMIQKGGGEQFVPANGPIGGLFGFGMVVACCSIQASVTFEDIYTGNVSKVDNVPLLLAAPASLFTTTAYSSFDKINTAFQSTSGSYMGVSQNGFITPLKLLLTLRRGVENVDPYLVASLKQYIIDCVPGSTTFNMNDFQKTPNMVDYVLTHSRPNGLTTYWNNLNTAGTAIACQDAAAKLDAATTAFPASDELKRLINAGMKDKNPMGGSYTPDNVTDSINNIVPSLWATAQSSDQFMLNALFFNQVWGTYNCLDSVQDQNSFNLCMVSLTQQDEQFRSDAAASGSFFAKIMMPTMIFLQLLFFGFAPIVIIYGLFKGAGALMMYIKYLGFGIWTSSWLPFSAVIQMYIQNDVADKLAQFTDKGLTPGNLNAVYYDVLATRLGIASDMLAATPLISAAMLGVTGYGMVSLANRWSGRDHNDEKLQSPDILKNGAHVDVSSRNQYGSEYQGNANSGLGRSDAVWSKAGLQQTLGTATQSAMGADHSKRSESSSAVEASLRQVMSYKSGDNWSDSRMQSLEQAHSKMTQQSMKMGDKIADSLGFTGSQRDAFTQSFNANVGFSGLFGGVSTGIQNATGKEMSKAQATQVSSDFGAEIAKNESDMKAWKAAVSSTFAHSSGKEAATENGLSRRLSSTSADTQSSFERFQKATSAESKVSASAEINEQSTGGNLTRSPEGMQALNSAIANLSDSQRAAFNKKFPELETRYAQQSKGMVGAREAAQLWALKAVGEDTAFASVVSSMQTGTVNGPTDGNAERFQNVGNRAAQVSDNPGGQVANANIGMPTSNVPGVNPNQVGPTGAPQPQTLDTMARGLDPWGHSKDGETYINSQLPGGTEQAKDQIRGAKRKVENGDTTISPQQMADHMSSDPIVNSVTALGIKEQAFADENPKTAAALTAATFAIPGAGWGGAAVRGAQAARAGLAASKAAEGLKVAETGIEVAQASRAATAAGREIPAVLRSPGQATRVVNPEQVAEAAEAVKTAGKAAQTAGREFKDSSKIAAKLSVEPGVLITGDHMASTYKEDQQSNGAPAHQQAPGTGVGAIRAESHQGNNQQNLMMPLAPPADALAPLGGHAGNLMSVGNSNEPMTPAHGGSGGYDPSAHTSPAVNHEPSSHTPVTLGGGHSPASPGLMPTGGGSESPYGNGMVGSTEGVGSSFGGTGHGPVTYVTANHGAPHANPADAHEAQESQPKTLGGGDKGATPGARGSSGH